MRIVILGSGTSSGVPLIGCTCSVCISDHPRNKRLRSSVEIQLGDKALLVDTSPDLREQAIRFGLERVDAVLYTHAHADHIHGIDELRVYNLRHFHEIPCYGNADVMRRIGNYFEYIFDEEERESVRPFLETHEVVGTFTLFGVSIVPVPLWHGSLPVLGYRIGNFAYLTDVNRIPDSSWELLEGLDLVILDALRQKPHATHFSIGQALEVIEKVKPKRAVLTHLSHLVDYTETENELPKGVNLAYDGMQLEVEDPPHEERSGP
jgi:phosphoribosyl 1,2-cyclic phosphate phosphodiesterase